MKIKTINILFEEGYTNKAILVETIRRAIVRNASVIQLVKPATSKIWDLTIMGEFTNKQEKEIKIYTNYTK